MGRLLIVIVCFVLVACGGGGGGGGGGGISKSSFEQSSSISSTSADFTSSSFSSGSSSSISPVELQAITRENTPYLTTAVFSLFELTASFSNDLSGLYEELELLPNGKYSDKCSGGGNLTLTVSADRSAVEFVYDNCIVDGSVISGKESVQRRGNGTVQPYQVLFNWSDLKTYEVASPAVYERLNGQAVYVGKIGNSYDDDAFFSINFNGQVQNSAQGTLVVEDANFLIGYSMFDYQIFSMFEKKYAYSGRIHWLEKGAADFIFENGVLKLTGSTSATSKIELADGLRISWDKQNDGLADAFLVYNNVHTTDLINLLTDGSGEIVRSDKNNEIFHSYPKYMVRGKTYTVDIRDAFTHTSLSLLDFGVKVDGVSDSGGDWIQPEIGKFIFSFPGNQEDQTYNLVFFARDTGGENTYEIPISFFVGADFDKDDIPDKYDDDDDNDSVADVLDQYPFDSAESADTDNDGIPDNQDSDADADGVPNFADANPVDDSNCPSANSCYAHQVADALFLDKDGVLYYQKYQSALNVIDSHAYIPRFDTKTGEFLPPLRLPETYLGSAIYEPEQHKIYFSGKQEIYVADLATQKLSLLLQSDRLFSVRYVENNHVVIGRQVYNGSSGLFIESYNFNGQLISSYPADDRLYTVVQYKYANYCDSALTSDSNGNLFLSNNAAESTCSNNSIGYDKQISSDKSRIYRGDLSDESGIYSTSGGNLLVSVPSQPEFYWVANGYVLYDRYGVQNLELHDEAGVVKQTFSIPDAEFFLSLNTDNTRIVLSTRVSESGRTNIRVFDSTLSLLGTYGY